jgi:hypothetical protein
VPVVVLAVVAVVLVVVVVVLVRRRRAPDAVDTFRRQIDALSPEARRPVVDQVQRIEQDDDESPEAPNGP